LCTHHVKTPTKIASTTTPPVAPPMTVHGVPAFRSTFGDAVVNGALVVPW